MSDASECVHRCERHMTIHMASLHKEMLHIIDFSILMYTQVIASLNDKPVINAGLPSMDYDNAVINANLPSMDLMRLAHLLVLSGATDTYMPLNPEIYTCTY